MKEKLRIAFYTDNYLPINDGVISYIVTMRKELEKRGHEVFILTAGDSKTAEIAKNDPHVLVFRGIKFIDGKSTIVLDPSLLLQPITGKRFDIIHAHSPFLMGLSAAALAKLTGAKLVSTFHTYFFHRLAMSKYVSYFSKLLAKNRVFLKLSQLIMIGYLKLYYSGCARIISPSRFIKRVLRKNGIKNVEVLNHGIALDKTPRVTRQEARRLLGIPKKQKIILYLGRVAKEKNLLPLIKAGKFLEKKGFRVIIAGGGPQLDEYRGKSDLLGLRSITFTGSVNEEEKEYYYRAADLFCNPSTFDTGCISALEAMKFNTPILVPRACAQTELIESGRCGEAFDQDDAADLAKKAMLIVNNRRKYFPKKAAGRFSIKKAADGLIAIYRKVLSNKQSRKRVTQ